MVVKVLTSSFLALVLSINLINPEIFNSEPAVIEVVEAVEETKEEPIESVEFVKLELPVTAEPAPEEIVEPEPILEPAFDLTDEEIFLIAWCMVGEAEGESELGKRLVIDVILNRMDNPRFADTAHDVIYAPEQFEAMWNGRAERCKDKVTEEMIQLVKEELLSRTNDEVLYFRMHHYHKGWGTPLFQEGVHYFSK